MQLSWCYLSERQGIKAADSFLRMMELSTWSHSTYVFIAAGAHLSAPVPGIFVYPKALWIGALLDLPLSERTPEIEARITHLFESLPALFNQKRVCLSFCPAVLSQVISPSILTSIRLKIDYGRPANVGAIHCKETGILQSKVCEMGGGR